MYNAEEYDILEKLAKKIPPVLVECAEEALKIPNYGGLKFASLLLEDALKYSTLYPYATGCLVNSKASASWNEKGEVQHACGAFSTANGKVSYAE